MISIKEYFKGGYLDFLHLTELKKKMYMYHWNLRKQYKSSKIKHKKITNKQILMGVPLKGYVASEVRFGSRSEKQYFGNDYPVTNEA